jgi:superfamily I DNA/RNA helicase
VQLPGLLLGAYDEKRIAPGTYQAILVDEGQDFADDWYRAVLRALDPAANSLFIALDSSQTIYRRRVSWKEIGIQVAGRTRVLRVDYRNTRQILATAYGVIQDLDAAGTAVRETGEEYLVPERALREGPMPELGRSRSEQGARQDALDWIRRLREQGTAPEEILVLCLNRAEITRLETWLEDAGIAAQVLGRRGEPGAVKLSTVHSAKGLDADAVLLILSARQLERRDEAEARRLLYIAMTRARTNLRIASYGRSPLMAQLADAIRRGEDHGD